MNRQPDYTIKDEDGKLVSQFWWTEMKYNTKTYGGYSVTKSLSFKGEAIGVQGSTEFVPFYQEIQCAYRQWLDRVIVGEADAST